MKLTLAVDLDGVIIDFNRSLGQKLGVDMVDRPWPMPGVYYQSTVFGLTRKAVQDAMKGVEFWRNMKPFSYGLPLLKYLEDNVGQQNIIILTRPAANGDSYKGKFEWIEEYLPNYREQILMGTPKHACARTEVGILIDDWDDNVDKFKEYGGVGILFPQPWNRLHALAADRLNVLKDELEVALHKDLPPMEFS